MALRVKLCWTKVSCQLEVTKRLESNIPDMLRDVQREVLCILETKLKVAIQKSQKLTKSQSPNVLSKLKFALLKDNLEETITDLESWQNRHDLSWYSVVRHAPTAIDTILRSAIAAAPEGTADSSLAALHLRQAFVKKSSGNVFIREEALQSCSTVAIPFSTAALVKRPGDPNHLLADAAPSTTVEPRDAQEFARRLRHSDPLRFGLLSCKGVVRHSSSRGVTFLFRVPEGYSIVRSLRQQLLSNIAHESLSDCLEMARQLVKAVYFTHLFDFVHKDIRPETILSIGKADQQALPSTAFLTGFQVIRKALGRTNLAPETRWEKNLYRHPRRQGSEVDYYVMQHDIYSLGVCLLEMGLWKSFIVYGTDGSASPSSALGFANDEAILKNPHMLKEHLVALCRSNMLKARMGSKYSRVVETCLTCLDEDNLDFGNVEEFQDGDGVEVGVRYIEKVVDILEGISL